MSAHDPRGGPARFTETRAADSEPDARIGALLRRVPPPLPMPAARLERVAFGLLGRRARQARPRRRWALVTVVLLGASGLVFAREPLVGLVRALRARGEHPAVPVVLRPAPMPAMAEGTSPAPAAQAPPTTRPTPHPVPAPRPQDQHDRQDRPRRQRHDPPRRLALAEPATAHGVPAAGESPPREPAPDSPALRAPLLAPPDGTNIADVIKRPLAAPPARSPYRRLGEETAILRRALQNLRHDDDAAGALEALDEYDRRFPFGVMRPSAQLVRIDALLALGRQDEALALLNATELGGNPRADELQITRAELRARRDCGAAMTDFTHALARTPPDALTERALRGRALCARQLDDQATMRADLQQYLARFPSGGFADRARALLR
jgi:hypothetical protein